MNSFKENLERMPAIDDLSGLALLDDQGNIIDIIENKPGKQGSLRVYRHLADKYGAINPQAAEEGIALFAEHTEAARSHPGSHPNIDRLLDLISSGSSLQVRLLAA